MTEQEKVYALEHCVLYGSADDLKKIIFQHGSFDYTARSLGYACLYGGIEKVRLLLENGADFKVKPRVNPLSDYVSAAHSDYRLMPVATAQIERIQQRSGYVYPHFDTSEERYGDPARKIEIPMVDNSQRAGIIKLLLDHKCAGFDGRKALIYAAIWNCTPAITALREAGVKAADTILDMQPNMLKEVLGAIKAADEKEMLALLNFLAEELGEDSTKWVIPQKLFNSTGNPEILIRRNILSYIYAHFNVSDYKPAKMLQCAVEQNAPDSLEFLAEQGYLNKPSLIEKYVALAEEKGSNEVLAWLLDYQNSHVDIEKEAKKAEKQTKKQLSPPTSAQLLRRIWKTDSDWMGGQKIISYQDSNPNVVIPAKIGRTPISSIFTGTFYDHPEIETAIVEEGIRTIGAGAFRRCKELRFMQIPASVRSIHISAFEGCTQKLEFRTEPETVGAYFAAWYHDHSKPFPVSVDADGEVGLELSSIIRTPMQDEPEDLSTVIFMGKPTKIPRRAFAGSKLQKITLPDTLKEIGDGAFMSCTHLEEVLGGNGVEQIGNSAFLDCSRLKKFTVPPRVTALEEGVFINCAELKELKISGTIEKVGFRALDGCPADMNVAGPRCPELERHLLWNQDESTPVPLPDGTKEIGPRVFCGTAHHTVVIPEGIKKIQDYAFDRCGTLKTVIPSSVKTIGKDAYYGCKDATIVTPKDSAAEAYATKMRIPCEII